MTTAILVEDKDGARLLTLTVPGVVVRAATVLPFVLAVGVTRAAAPDVPWWPSAVLVVLAILAAELPDSGAGLVALGGLVAWWLLAVDEPATGWALVVASGGLLFHVALAHAAAGPPGCLPTPGVVARIGLRCAVVLLVTSGVALVVEVAEEWGEPPTLVVGGTLALVGALPWLAARQTGQPSGPQTAASDES